MTLDICRLLFNVINKQMKIQHNARTAGVYRLDQIPAGVKDRILGKYGKDFLGDANLLVFFRGLEDKKSIQKLFKTIDNALGNDANLLVVGDFKKLSMNDGAKTAVEPAGDDEDTETEMSDDAKIQNDVEEVLKEDDAEDGDAFDDSDEPAVSAGDPDDSGDPDVEDKPDSKPDAENPGFEEEPPEREVPGEYVFIKITIKD